MPINGGIWGRDNPHFWIVCPLHGLKYPAACTRCPLCRYDGEYGEEYLESKVRDSMQVKVVPA